MEKSISDNIIDEVNSMANCFARKRFSGGFTSTNGYPDITGAIEGRRLEIETKQPGKSPSKIQYKRLKEFRDYGCISFWTTSVKDAMAKIRVWQAYYNKETPYPGDDDIENTNIAILKDLAA